MQIYFSKSTRGFYSSALAYPLGIPDDKVEVSMELYTQCVEGMSQGLILEVDMLGYPSVREPDAPPAPTSEDIIEGYVKAVQIRIDEYAQSWGYDTIYTAATYLDSHIPRFKAEAQALITWRDNVWYFLNVYCAKVLAGDLPMPIGTADVLSRIPASPERPIV